MLGQWLGSAQHPAHPYTALQIRCQLHTEYCYFCNATESTLSQRVYDTLRSTRHGDSRPPRHDEGAPRSELGEAALYEVLLATHDEPPSRALLQSLQSFEFAQLSLRAWYKHHATITTTTTITPAAAAAAAAVHSK